MPRIAIIGAGVSGLAAAFQLAETDAEVRIFEKSRGLSGRAASRSKNGCRYDHGANYFKLNCNEIARLLFESLPTDQLCRIMGDIWTFDQDSIISPGDPVQNRGAKWNYRGGISTLGKLLVEVAELDVELNTHIEHIRHDGLTWTLQDSEGRDLGTFDALLLTAPAPQTTALLESGNLDEDIAESIATELKRARYHSQFSVIQNFSGTLELPGQAYALINSDREHPIAWLSHENQKASRVPDGETLLIAQMAPDWSHDHYEDSQANIIEAAYEATKALLGPDLPRLNWADTQRWRYAHPHSAASLEALKLGTGIGLFFAGDMLIGKGRIPRALETGFAAARQLTDHFALAR